ncbi:MAG: hypothetical protein KC635_07950, partial [Myxococcales bacterium]|nr:hypothetical protein [Myxococcales bacterium]
MHDNVEKHVTGGTAAARILRRLAGALVIVALAVPACDSTVTESDLMKWTNNDLGLARIKEVVADPKQPMDTRVRALEVVVEKGFPLRVRGMLDAIVDDADRDTVSRRLADQLLKHVENKSAAQYDAKDTLMSMETLLDKEVFEHVKKSVAEWAFADVTWDSPSEEVQQKIQSRIYVGQIEALGHYGWNTAGILIANGFAVDKMARFLGAAKDPVATDLLLKGMRKLHASVGAQGYQLDALRSSESPAAAAYLLEMYLNESLDDEIRAGAFNVAVEMMGLPGMKKDHKLVDEQLKKLMAGDVVADRWLGALNLVHLSGTENLDIIMASFKDDGKYKEGQEDPAKSTMDLCLDLHDLGLEKEANAKLMPVLQNGNRIQKSIAIVCLKANHATEARADLKALAAKAGTPDDPSIDDFLGEELTLGKLAQNALDGLDLLDEVDKDKAAGKYTDEQASQRRLSITFKLALTGDAYKQEVEKDYQGWLEEQKAPPPAPPEAPKDGAAPAAPGGAPAPGGEAPAEAPAP